MRRGPPLNWIRVTRRHQVSSFWWCRFQINQQSISCARLLGSLSVLSGLAWPSSGVYVAQADGPARFKFKFISLVRCSGTSVISLARAGPDKVALLLGSSVVRALLSSGGSGVTERAHNNGPQLASLDLDLEREPKVRAKLKGPIKSRRQLFV